MSYRVEGFEAAASFDAGTSLLLSGNPMDASEHLLDVVTPEPDEQAIVITTKTAASTVLSELENRGALREQLGIIDCTGQESAVDDVPIRALGSPGDLTGISLEFAKLLSELGEDRPVRVGFNSVSTTLMYTELRTMFRFLHVFTARIRSGRMFGAFAVDPSMHEPQAHNTLRAVFDCEAEIGDDGVTLRGTGFQR